ncbi:3-deoxy-D-manno-octulosonic acid transferase [Fibrobacterota bacterium]
MIFYPVYNTIWTMLYLAARFLSIWDIPRRWHLPERVSMPRARKGPSVWFHCSSLGEAKGLAGLLSSLSFSTHFLVVTAATGQAVAYLTRELSKQVPVPGYAVRAAPLDHRRTLEAFLRSYRVKALCLYEAELWPNCLNSCFRKKIPVLLVSARIGKRTRRLFSLFPEVFKDMTRRLNWIQAQNPGEADFLSGYAGVRAETGMDFKLLPLLRGAGQEPDPPEKRDAFAFISLHLKELHMCLPVLPDLLHKFPIIIFPRYLSQTRAFNRLLAPLGFEIYSNHPEARALLIDAYGKVIQLTKRCRACLVGGSLIPHGGHNLWEPLASGAGIYMGPHHDDQAETAAELEKQGFAAVIENPRDLLRIEPRPLPAEKVDFFLNRYRSASRQALTALVRKLNTDSGIRAHIRNR